MNQLYNASEAENHAIRYLRTLLNGILGMTRILGVFMILGGGSDFAVSRILDARLCTDFMLGKGNAAIFFGMERLPKAETSRGK